jgi:hypothetical protein
VRPQGSRHAARSTACQVCCSTAATPIRGG